MIATAFSLLVTMETEEAQIAQGLRRRDPELLDTLIEQYQHRLLRYLLHLTGNRAAGRRPLSGHLAARAGEGPPVRWTQQVRVVAVFHRTQCRHRPPAQAQPASLDAMNEQEDGAVIDPPAGGPTAFDLIAQQETAEQIETAMERVPVVYREVLVLRFQEHMKLEEIAQLIHIPVATVKTRLYRGVMALRPAFQAGVQ